MGERLLHKVPITLSRALEHAQHAIPPHHDGLQYGDGKIPIDRSLLWEIADFGAMMALELLARAVKNLERAFQWTHESQDGLAQGRLAGPVRADHPDELPAGDLEGYILERNDTGKSEGGMIKTNNRMRHGERLGQGVGKLHDVISEQTQIGLGSWHGTG